MVRSRTPGRATILKVHTRKVPLDERVNLELLARGTPGFSGADLANLVNEAALIAAKRIRTALQVKTWNWQKIR